MLKIKSIKSLSIDSFDKRVNEMIESGWILIESSIRSGPIQRNIHSCPEVMHFATLKKEHD